MTVFQNVRKLYTRSKISDCLPKPRASGQSNLTTGRIVAAHGRFNGIRQVVPVCTLFTQYMLFWAHSSPNFKRNRDQLSRFLAQLTAESGHTLQWAAPSPLNCPFPCGILTPSNTWFLGPTRVLNPNGISIGSAVFPGLTTVTDRQTTLLGQ